MTLKKNESDSNLLTLEDRVKAENENLEITRVVDPDDQANKDPDNIPMQESQVINQNDASGNGTKEAEENEDDFDVFVRREQDLQSKSMAENDSVSNSLK